MNEPRPVPLERLLAEEAERAIPGDIDVWANVSQQLHAREQLVLPLQPDTSVPEPGRTPLSRASRRFDGGTRSAELVGNAVSFALGALAIAIVALVLGLPGRGNGSTGIGAGPPESAVPSVSSPAPVGTNTVAQPPTPESGTNVECTLDLDISPESEANRVVIPIEIHTTGRCNEGRVLQLAIVDAKGQRSQVAGNPYAVPLTSNGQGRRATVEVEWRNWCGEPERFRIESRFGSERHTLPLPEPPSCVDQNLPSTMRPIASNATPADPNTAVP